MKATSTALLSSLLLLACGGGDSNNQGVSSIISPDEGGSLRIEGSETGLSIPEGAVSAEIELSLELASVADFASNEEALDQVLVFSPSMSLAVPATISVQLAEDFDFSQSVHLEQFTDGIWLRPEISGLEIGSGGIAYGQVQSLLPTVVVLDTAE